MKRSSVLLFLLIAAIASGSPSERMTLNTVNGWQSWYLETTLANPNPTFIINNGDTYGYDFNTNMAVNGSPRTVIEINVPLEYLEYDTSANPVNGVTPPEFANMKPTITFKGATQDATMKVVTAYPNLLEEKASYDALKYVRLDPRTGHPKVNGDKVSPNGGSINVNRISGIEVVPGGYFKDSHLSKEQTIGVVNFDVNLDIDLSSNPFLKESTTSVQSSGILVNLENGIDDVPNTKLSVNFNKDLKIKSTTGKLKDGKVVNTTGFSYNSGLQVYYNGYMESNLRTELNVESKGKVDILTDNIGKNIPSYGLVLLGYGQKEGNSLLHFSGEYVSITTKGEQGAGYGIRYLKYKREKPKQENSRKPFIPDNPDLIDTIHFEENTPVTMNIESTKKSYGINVYSAANHFKYIQDSPLTIKMKNPEKGGQGVAMQLVNFYNGTTDMVLNKDVTFDGELSFFEGIKAYAMAGTALHFTSNGKLIMKNPNLMYTTIYADGDTEKELHMDINGGIESAGLQRSVVVENENPIGNTRVVINGTKESGIILPTWFTDNSPDDSNDKKYPLRVTGENASLVINDKEKAPVVLGIINRNPVTDIREKAYSMMAENKGKLELHLSNPSNLGLLWARANNGTGSYTVTNDNVNAYMMFDSRNGGSNHLTVKNHGNVTILPLNKPQETNAFIEHATLKDGGRITLSHDDENQIYTKTFTIDTLDGDQGIFTLNIDASNNTDNDKLIVNHFKNGKHYIDLNETGHGDLSKAEDSVVAYVKDPAENSGFLAKDGEGTLYYKRYLLAKRAAREGAPVGYIDEWYLKGIVNIAPEVKPTPAVDTISAIGEYNLYMLHSIQDDFHRRIGFLKGLENEKDVWARVTHNNLKSRGDNYFKAHNSQYEVGFNFNKKIEEDKTIFTGVSLDFIDGKVSLRNTSGKQELYMIGLYHSRVGKDGSYSDFTAHFGNNRYGKMGIYKDNDIIEIEKRKSNLWNLSYEYGKHLTHENYFIEPQVQLSYTQLNSNKGDIHKDNDLYRIEYSPTKSLLGRAGVMAGTTILRDGEKRGEVYLLFNLLHEFKGNTKYSIEGEKESLSRSHRYHKTFEEIGLGFNYNYSENTSYYFDIRTNVGRTPVRNMQWNFGLRHKF